MKHLSILIPEGTLILDTIVGTLNLFKMANSYSRRIKKSKEDVFSIDLVGLTRDPITCHKFFQVQATKTIEEVETVPSVVSRLVIAIVTGSVGSVSRTTLNVAVPPASVVVRPCQAPLVLARACLCRMLENSSVKPS